MSRVLQTRKSRVAAVWVVVAIAYLALTPFSIQAIPVFAKGNSLGVADAWLIVAIILQVALGASALITALIYAIWRWIQTGTE